MLVGFISFFKIRIDWFLQLYKDIEFINLHEIYSFKVTFFKSIFILLQSKYIISDYIYDIMKINIFVFTNY